MAGASASLPHLSFPQRPDQLQFDIRCQLHFVLFSQVTALNFLPLRADCHLATDWLRLDQDFLKPFKSKDRCANRLTTGSRVTVTLSKHGDLQAAFKKEKTRTFIYCRFISSSLVANCQHFTCILPLIIKNMKIFVLWATERILANERSLIHRTNIILFALQKWQKSPHQ